VASETIQKLLRSQEDLTTTPSTTYRNTSPEMEAEMYKPYPVLDHGFVRLVDYMGTEASIVQAARVSYGKGTKKVSQDRGLIRYLMRHRHSSPVEMCEAKWHVKMPIFVARQWIRHRTASINEYSARYSILDREFYIPEPDRLGVQSTTNNQGTGHTLTAEQNAQVLSLLKRDALQAFDTYGEMIDEHNLARELARINLPVSAYTQWYWKIDLHNLLHFMALRSDHHSQHEIRVYSDVILSQVEKWVPNVIEAWDDYHPLRNAHTFSGPEMFALMEYLSQQGHDSGEMRALMLPILKEGGCSGREIRAFFETLGIQRDAS